ncbi:MAG: HAD family hydrolase [Thiolinea sp.]
MTIRCVAFDLDDTLWDCKTVIDHAEHQLYQWLQTHQPRIADHHSLTTLIGSRVEHVSRYPELHHDLGALRKQWLASLADEFGLERDWVEPAFAHFLEARNQVELFPGVLEALQELKQVFSLGVITNGNADVERIGLGHLFDFAHSSAAAGAAKPDPLIFAQAVAMAGVAAHEMVYVGDDPEKDIIGAQQAGLRTIWYNPLRRELSNGVNPDAIMTNFNEIARLVQSL